MVPAHYVVELDQVGCPDPVAPLPALFRSDRRPRPDATGGGGRGLYRAPPTSRTPVDRAGARRTSRSPWRSPAASTALPALLLARHACRLGRTPDRRPRVHARSRRRRRRGAGRTAVRALGIADSVGAHRRAGRALRPRGGRFASSRTTTRSTSSARPRRCACCGGIRERYPSLTLPARRRRRRREPQVVSARGLGPDALERPAQPAALSGGLGRRRHQAQPALLRGTVARLCADVCAGGALGFTAFSPFTRALGHRRRGGDSVRAGARRSAERLYDAEAGGRERRHWRPCRASRCRSIRSGGSRTAPATPARASPRPGAGGVQRSGRSGCATPDARDRRSGNEVSLTGTADAPAFTRRRLSGASTPVRARASWISSIASRRPKAALDPLRAYACAGRGRARRRRRARSDRSRLPHQSRVPVPLRDVRPVAQHARRAGAARARLRRRSATRSPRLPPRASDQAV